MKSTKFIFLLSIITVFQITNLQAEVKLPKIFSSNMVLQQGMEIPVWGWADKGERVSVVFNGKTVRTNTGKDGKWKVKLPVQQFGGPFTMTVQGKNTLVFENILIGDVWVCSGQSNMEMQVVQSNDAEKEIAAANYPKIRLFTVPKTIAQFPKDDIDNGEWVECSPETVAKFSAVGYFFGRKLQEELDIPIGLLHTSWGGTVAETWSSAETIENDPDLKALLAELRQLNMDKQGDDKKKIGPNSYPTLLFNAMLNPVIPYGIKGAIWYQGESNADRAKQYQRVFPEMITDWRNHWAQGNFPFYFVSLANFNAPTEQPGESNWAELREAQTKTLSLPNTGMAVTIDIGEANDIHPKNKQDVGLRLALNALKLTYNKDFTYSGPMYKSVEFKDGKAYITFSETGSGLTVKNRYGYVNGFTIAGSDKKFRWAKAEIIDNNRIVVYSDEVKSPISVRYGWSNNPGDVNLYNHEGLPANPFRTDEWPGITK